MIVIAHRGGVVDEHHSENSYKALDEAIRRGYTHVEIDARVTADGHVVCFHHDDLAEQAGVEGRISELTRDAVTRVVLTRSQQTIPTFEEYCARCAGRIGVMVDIKGCRDSQIDAYVQEVEAALAGHGLLDSALMLINKEPKDNQDKIARLLMGKAKVSWRKDLNETRQAAETHPAPGFADNYYVFNHGADFAAEDVEAYQRLGLRVIVSINTWHYRSGDRQQQGEDHIRQMQSFGVDGLQIDSCYDSALFGT